MKKQTLILIAICVSGIIAFFVLQPDSQITNHPSSGTSIVALGDSLVRGVGATPENDFVSLLSQKIEEPIINMGISGNTSELVLERVDDVIAQNPRIVILLVGGNDFLRSIPIDTTFKNIDRMVEQLHDASTVVVLLGVRGGLLSDQYSERFEQIAQNRGTIYVPNVLSGLLGNSQLMSDAIHPNDEGYKIISEKVFKAIEDYI